MKRILIVMLVVVMLLGVTACGGAQEETAQDPETETAVVQLHYATVHPNTYSNGIAAAEFAKLVNEQTDGRVEVIVHYSGELGDQKSYIEQCQMGTLDFGDVNASPITPFVPEMGVLSMPYLFKDRETKWEVISSDIGLELLKTCENADMYGLCFFEAGERNYYANKPIRCLEDLEGLKIRVQQSQVCVDQVNAMGASAVPMAFSEIYSSGQSGVIDGNECNHPTYLSQSHYEVFPYYTFDGHVAIPDMLVASKISLDTKVTPEDRDTILNIGHELWAKQLEEYEAFEDEAYQTLEEKGVEFIYMDDAEIEKFRRACDPVYEKYDADYGEWIERIKEVQGE